MKTKTKWMFVLFMASLLFLVGLTTKQPLYNIGTIVLAFIVRQKGYDSLFKEFDDKQQSKREKSVTVIRTIRENKKSKIDGGFYS